MTTKKTDPKENFSKILNEVRNIAIAITKDHSLRVKYDGKQPTSSFHMETNEITLSLSPYPSFVLNNAIVFRKVLDGDNAHECVLKGTKILTARGFKPIEQVQMGDMVLSEGRFVKVLETIHRDYKGELITVKAHGILPFSVTASHPIRMIRGKHREKWTNATFLRKGDYLQIPKLSQTIFTFDNTFMEFLGVFIGDGYANLNSTITIALETEQDAKYVLALVQKLYQKGRVYKRKTHFEVSFDNKDLSDYLRLECYLGTGHSQKQIPNFVYLSSQENIRAFYKGYYLADGSKEGSGKRITTVSYDLAIGLQKLLTKIGIFVTIHKVKREGETTIQNRVVYQNDRYAITEKNSNAKQEEFSFWVKIRKVERTQINAEVFNLRTELETYEINNVLVHNCGHLLLTKPNWEYFNNWATKIKRKRGFYRLAHELCNIIEDKRINHFIILRFRFDVGKRLLLANLILKDMIDNTIEEKQARTKGSLEFTALENLGENPTQEIKTGQQNGVYMVAILCNQGLYAAKCTNLWNKLSPEATKDCKTALEVLENVKYKRLRIEIIRSCQEIYDLVAKHLKADYTSKNYVVSRRGGDLKGEMSERLKELLEKEAKIEQDAEDKKKHLEDLQKGSGAGEGTGLEIPAPQPDYEAYSKLLDECKPEITALLNQLKKTLKPRCSRQIFQKRGKIMCPIVPRIYANSFRGTVRNVYTNVSTQFEKEQVAIAFAFDFSGSVSKRDADRITTILNEVFGHYVDDYGFSVGCFGADTQKIKTFFESFQNTRARVGNISVNPCGTEVSVLLEAYLRMFNTIKGERRRILVIASDFAFCDNDRALEILSQYARYNIECLFIGFCNCDNVNTFGDGIKNLKVKRTKIEEISQLPQRFLDVYLSIQK